MPFEMLRFQICGYDHRGSEPYISNAKQSYSAIQTVIYAIGDFRKPNQIKKFLFIFRFSRWPGVYCANHSRSIDMLWLKYNYISWIYFFMRKELLYKNINIYLSIIFTKFLFLENLARHIKWHTLIDTPFFQPRMKIRIFKILNGIKEKIIVNVYPVL